MQVFRLFGTIVVLAVAVGVLVADTDEPLRIDNAVVVCIATGGRCTATVFR